MHRAQSGIWTVPKKYDLSGSWWQSVDPRNVSRDQKVSIETVDYLAGH